MRISILIGLFASLNLFAQTKLPPIKELDIDLLNQKVLKQLNRSRQKARVSVLVLEKLLEPIAKDHADYMKNNLSIGHIQTDISKTLPKNRADAYGQKFDQIGENILVVNLASRKSPKTYETLAKYMVDEWLQDSPNNANINNVLYRTSYTAISIQGNLLYTCQILASWPYTRTNSNLPLNHQYEQYNPDKCKRCQQRAPQVKLIITEDRTIIATANKARYLKRGLRLNPINDGLAADIVYRNQLDCDSGGVYNGQSHIRGIPLNPVFKKDFNRNGNRCFWKYVNINLGQIPEWVSDDYEINITAINNNQPCNSLVIKPVTSSFNVDLDIGIYIDTITRQYQYYIYDTISKKISFEKSATKSNESQIDAFKKLLSIEDGKISKVELNGYSSIEGTEELNRNLYIKRANHILDQLKTLGVDQRKVRISAEENFKEFRQDIKGSKYNYLGNLLDDDLKNKVNTSPGLADSLEPFLAKHRYVSLLIIVEHIKTIKYDSKKLYDQFNYYSHIGNETQCKQLQKIEYNLFTQNKVSLEEIKALTIPFNKKMKNVLHDRALMIHKLDTLNPAADENLKIKLNELKKLESNDTRINTSLAVLKYFNTESKRSAKKYYKNLDNVSNISPVIRSRMKINLAARLDQYKIDTLNNYVSNLFLMNSKTERDIKLSKLNPDESMQIAKYFAFFGKYKTAYELSKKNVLKSNLIEDKVFFLKLILYTDVIPNKTKLKHLRQIYIVSGTELCKYFEPPYVNFQVLDDTELLKQYCRNCR